MWRFGIFPLISSVVRKREHYVSSGPKIQASGSQTVYPADTVILTTLLPTQHVSKLP